MTVNENGYVNLSDAETQGIGVNRNVYLCFTTWGVTVDGELTYGELQRLAEYAGALRKQFDKTVGLEPATKDD